MHQHLVLLVKIKILCTLEKVLLCPPPGDKESLFGCSFSISLSLCLVNRTSHVKKSISCKIMSLVGRFSPFHPLQCFSLLKVQIVFSKCSYSIFCCQWSSNLFPATRNYYNNPRGILAALTNSIKFFPLF